MLKGIDISSHQGDINLSPLPIDFVIVKATEGMGYVNPYCDKKIQEAKNLGLLWGFYHYARNNDPLREAQYFYDNCRNYIGEGTPVLDWEEDQNVSWVNAFVNHFHNLSGIWPWIYGNPWRFNQGGVETNCARWIASYPSVKHPNLDYDPGNTPATQGLVACWQYASDGRISGYDGNLDLNHFFGDQAAWRKYANPNADVTPAPAPAPAPTPEEPPAIPTVSILENDEYKITIERK